MLVLPKQEKANFAILFKEIEQIQLINKLSSCTKEPYSNIFTRNNIKYEFIDTVGSADSSKDDIKNFELIINYFKKMKQLII